MTLNYYKTTHGNFGDDLNEFLWHDLLGKELVDQPDISFVGIGTLLNPDIYERSGKARYFMCLGSGAGYGPTIDDMLDDKWLYRVVRGPLSADRLGLPSEEACTDGAMLLACEPFYADLAALDTDHISFMPHHEALMWPHWSRACQEAGITFLDPTTDPMEILRKIASSKLVIADAMHAAICADVLRRPWVAASSSKDINSFKWRDWTQSMGLAYDPVTLEYRTPLFNLLRKTKEIADGSTNQTAANSTRQVFKKSPAPRPTKKRPSIARSASDTLLKQEARFGAGKSIFDNIVQSLTRLKSEQGVMSDDHTFESRRDQMAEHLNKVRALLTTYRQAPRVA